MLPVHEVKAAALACPEFHGGVAALQLPRSWGLCGPIWLHCDFWISVNLPYLIRRDVYTPT